MQIQSLSGPVESAFLFGDTLPEPLAHQTGELVFSVCVEPQTGDLGVSCIGHTGMISGIKLLDIKSLEAEVSALLSEGDVKLPLCTRPDIKLPRERRNYDAWVKHPGSGVEVKGFIPLILYLIGGGVHTASGTHWCRNREEALWAIGISLNKNPTLAGYPVEAALRLLQTHNAVRVGNVLCKILEVSADIGEATVEPLTTAEADGA